MTATPEQLKKLAEYMGYKVKTHHWWPEFVFDGEWMRFDPLQNPAQDAEIEIKFCMDTKCERGKWKAITWNFPNAVTGEGESPKEARLNCAIAYVEEL